MSQQYEEIGINTDSREERIQSLNDKGYTLIDGHYPYGQWLYSRLKDQRYEGIQPNILETWFGHGTEMNEVGEIFIDLRTE